jgi:hypothetical protein
MSTDPDQIRHDIERTQGEIGDDVDALTYRASSMADRANAMADKYNPRKAVNRRVNRIREAFFGARDKVMGTATSAGQATSAKAGQMRDRASHTAADVGHKASDVGHKASQTASDVGHAVGSVPQKAREQAQGSPLAAGLIAFGAGILVSSLLPASNAERRMAGRVKDTAMQHSDQLKHGLSGATQQMREGLREPARNAAESVKSAAGQAASNVRDESQWAAKDVKEKAQQAGQNVKSQRR